MARAIEDAVHIVTPSKVGEWVEATARDALGARAKLVEIVESAKIASPSAGRISTSSPSGSPTLRLMPHSAPREDGITHDLVITQFSTASAADVPREVGKKQRAVLLVGAGVAAAGLLMLTVSSLRSSPAPRVGMAAPSVASLETSQPVLPSASTAIESSVPAPPASLAASASVTIPAPAPRSTAVASPGKRPVHTSPTRSPYSRM